MTTMSSQPTLNRPSLVGRGLRVLRRYGTLVGLVLIFGIFSVASPTVFLSAVNLRNVLEQIAVLTVIAAVQTAVMVVGDFDLSVGAAASFSAIVAAVALDAGVPVPLAVLLALASGAVIGAVNGFLVAYIGLSAFIATLASMTSIVGLGFILSGGTTLIGFPAEFLAIGQGRLLGIPYTVFIAAVVVVVMALVLSRTTLGRRFYAIGGNAQAAELSGVNVSRARFTAFILVGLGAAMGGIFLVSRLNQAQATLGDSTLLPSIAAVFLGMTMYRDGSPRILGTLIGVGILGVLANGLNILGVNSYVQQAVTGVIIILAVAIPSFAARRKAR